MPDPNLSSFIWSVSDLLRGDDRQSELLDYNGLKSHRADIEPTFGEPLEWRQDPDFGRWSLSQPLFGCDANDRNDWLRQHRMLADHVVRLYRAVKPYAGSLLAGTHAATEHRP